MGEIKDKQLEVLYQLYFLSESKKGFFFNREKLIAPISAYVDLLKGTKNSNYRLFHYFIKKGILKQDGQLSKMKCYFIDKKSIKKEIEENPRYEKIYKLFDSIYTMID